MSGPPTRAVTAGCLHALMISVVTSAMLIINGAIVLAIVKAIAQSGSNWASRPDVAQLVLLTVPLVLVVAQWKVIDLIRGTFKRRS